MGRCVCLAPELPYIDGSRQSWTETDDHVTSEPANQTIEVTPVTVSHSQVSDKDESNPQNIPKTPSKPPSTSSSCQSRTESDRHVTSEPVNQTLETTPATVSHSQISNRDESNPPYIPKSPFKPLSMNRKGLGRVHGMMNLALATRQRRDFVGPRSPLVPFRLTGECRPCYFH